MTTFHAIADCGGRYAEERADNGADEFEKLMVVLRPELFRRALFLTRDALAADDLVQDALERALRARQQFRNGTNLRAWLNQILRNRFIDARRESRLRASSCEEVVAIADSGERVPGPMDVFSPEDVARAAEHLSAMERQILDLGCFERRPYREIAAKLRIRPATVGTRLFRVKAKLRQALLAECEARLAEVMGRAPGESSRAKDAYQRNEPLAFVAASGDGNA